MSYDWKITGKKILKHGGIVLIAGIIATYGDNQYYLILAPLIEGIWNSVKNWNC